MLELDATIAVIMVLFVALSWAVSRLYLRPVGALLEERRVSTEGVMEEARQKMAQMEQDLRRYRQQVQQARAENYKEQEEQRRRALDARQQLVHQARQEYERVIVEARHEILEQTARAKEWMAREAESLSTQIVKKLLA